MLQYSLVICIYRRIAGVSKTLSRVECLSQDKIIYNLIRTVVSYLSS